MAVRRTHAVWSSESPCRRYSVGSPVGGTGSSGSRTVIEVSSARVSDGKSQRTRAMLLSSRRIFFAPTRVPLRLEEGLENYCAVRLSRHSDRSVRWSCTFVYSGGPFDFLSESLAAGRIAVHSDVMNNSGITETANSPRW